MATVLVPGWRADRVHEQSTGLGQVYVMGADGGSATQLTLDGAWKDQVPTIPTDRDRLRSE
jgi:Tol biopolymer transport system component